MRLTCPNCGARYEVADTMIPPDGRDVQCSNCSTTWFQPGRRTDRQPAVRVERGVQASDPFTDAAPPPPSSPESPPPRQAEPGPTSDVEPNPEVPPPPQAPRRREIDPEVRDILREEAEREAQLRRAEADPVETQAEMPLMEEPDEVHRARRRAELEQAEDAFAASSASSARDLFPDIDEINSTLRDTGDRSPDESNTSDIETLDSGPRRRRGTRIGFLLAIALAAGAAGLYGNIDRFAALAPALAPWLERYEGAVDSARFWLDDLARSIGGGTEEG